MSEIFKNYAKIAIANGLVKQSYETNPRFDSRTVKEIANLYDVKIERPKDMEYKKNIVEDAHPEPVILFQSHDKINSLIENINERQNIIVNILKKMPNGNLTQKKYARDLVLSLIRVATDMDNQNKEELRILADTCAIQLQKKADFTDMISDKGGDAVDVAEGLGSGTAIGAIAGGLIGAFGGPAGIVGGAMAGAKVGAVLGGVLSAIYKTSPQAKNLVINANIARDQLADLIKDFPSDAFLHQLDNSLLHISNTASNYSQVVDKMHMPNSSAADKNEVVLIAHKYITELSTLNILMQTFLSNANMGKYAPQESDIWSKTKKPFTAIFGDDVSDEVKALQTLSTVIKATQKGIADAMNEAQRANSIIDESTNPVQSSEVASKSDKVAPSGVGENVNYTPVKEEENDSLAEIEKMLKNFK